MDFPKLGYPSTITIAGQEVIVYNIYGGGDYPVHGAYFVGKEEWQWVIGAWTIDGKKIKGVPSDLDLAIGFADAQKVY